jgi:general secretion pathway protein A
MRPDVLATLRILTNFDLDSRLVLSLVLAGDSRLQHLLERHDLEPVRRRLAHVAFLPLLSRDQTRAYLHHRLQLAAAPPELFPDEATDALYEISRGNLRALDHLALKTLELAAEQDRSEILPGVNYFCAAASIQSPGHGPRRSKHLGRQARWGEGVVGALV